jgi:hypothetical protein
MRKRFSALALLVMFTACKSKPTTTEASPSPSASTAEASASASASAPESGPALQAATHEGSAISRSAANDSFFVADEDHHALRTLLMPLGPSGVSSMELPGAPAQVLSIPAAGGKGERVLVTIRDPGMLLILERKGAALTEVARVAVPADAWGLAVTPDERTAIVTSAWTHQVTAVDLASAKAAWSVDVAREPRGVVVRADGKAAYVSHLVGAELTRVDLDTPKAKRLPLPTAPMRSKVPLEASLTYALVMSPDGHRVFAARHALGAPGPGVWFGTGAVDVLMTSNDMPLAPPKRDPPVMVGADPNGDTLATPFHPFVQPRAMIYRKSERTLLIASEGEGLLSELDALAIDPGAPAFGVMGDEPTEPPVSRLYGIPATGRPKPMCGAPTGLALTKDEQSALMYCRSSNEVIQIALETPGTRRTRTDSPVSARVPVAEEQLKGEAARGRTFFYDATDPIASGGLGCAGCHPEGRDDGHIWREVLGAPANEPVFVGGPDVPKIKTLGHPRQTPMLAGRVSSEGPYGWHAQNADLVARIEEGEHLHRWFPPPKKWDALKGEVRLRASSLAAFLRAGLVPPPHEKRELSPEEAKGKEIFSRADVACATCHSPDTEYTSRLPVAIKDLDYRVGFEIDTKKEFKTPSLSFIANTAPYFHDGRVNTLEELIDTNDDRMGKTNQLSKEEKAALVAFLKTL